MTDQQGTVRRTISFGNADYKDYLNILNHGGGKWMIKVVGHTVETDAAEIPEWRPMADT